MRLIPTQEELANHYKTYAYGREPYLSPITIKSYNALLDEFEKFRSTGKILDVGCGAGFFLEQAKKRGWEVHGTEYSEAAINVCEEKGINMKHGQLVASRFGETKFDVITSFEVIEHINNPNEDLSHIQKLLKSGGLFYCTTPNFNSAQRYYLGQDYNVIGYPEHLTYYTKKSLNRLVKSHGFSLKKFLSTGISVTRIKTSKGNSSEKLKAHVSNSSDENLRNRIEQKWYLGVAKGLVNFLFSITNTGMTLKGYYIKK